MENARESSVEARTPFIVWKDDFSVGHMELDEHHRTLVGILNDLYDATRDELVDDAVNVLVERLYHYTQFHFSREEDLMDEGDYPDLPKHRMIHRWMTRKTQDLRNHRFRHGTRYTDEVFSFLKNWWTNHILQLDKHYGPFVTRGVSKTES